MKSFFLSLLLACLFMASPHAQVTTTVYDFEGLTIGSPLNGQDGWMVTSIGASMNINNQLVVTTASNGAYVGSTAFRGASNGGNRIFRASRVNDGNFSFQNLGCKESVTLEWDHDVNFWSSNFRLGFDQNNDGDLDEAGEPGFGLRIGRGGVNTNPYRAQLYRANGSIVQQTLPLNHSGFSWFRFRIEIDMTANGGQGSATVSYRDLNNSGPWTAIPALTNVNMGFDVNATDVSNPANLNGMAYIQGADATTLDNITITTDEGPDTDGDNIADICDPDDDNDGVADSGDSNPLDPYLCGDSDADGCEDCLSGTSDPANDGTDTDGNGICNDGDPDDDNDGCLDEEDADPLTASGDSDCDGVADDCDVCPDGDDTVDNNGDGIPDCSQLLNYADYAEAWKCKKNKIYICHIPPGNPANAHTICVNKNALPAHFSNHGDAVGPCQSCGGSNMMAPTGNGGIAFHETESHLTMDIFPNPASSAINLHLHGLEDGGATLSMFDRLGREVLRHNLPEGTHAIALDLPDGDFVSGEYYVRLVSGKEVLTQFLVIRK